MATPGEAFEDMDRFFRKRGFDPLEDVRHPAHHGSRYVVYVSKEQQFMLSWDGKESQLVLGELAVGQHGASAGSYDLVVLEKVVGSPTVDQVLNLRESFERRVTPRSRSSP